MPYHKKRKKKERKIKKARKKERKKTQESVHAWRMDELMIQRVVHGARMHARAHAPFIAVEATVDVM